jgi:hypothetical protein
MKTFRYLLCLVGVFVALAFASVSSAQTNTYPDPTTITTAVQAPFNNALSWVIGALSVLTILGWVVMVIRKKRG